jgi:uncharacterized protein
MPVYLTPGVYRQPHPVEKSGVRLVRTDVAGFVGFAERGPLPRPQGTLNQDETGLKDPFNQAREAAVRLTSWNQFRAIFGGFVPYGYLAYAVRAFFDNGGSTCYVVRVAAVNQAKPASHKEAGFVATARSAGSWGNRINLTITPLKPTEFSLRVALMPGPDSSAPTEEENYNRLSVTEGPFFVVDRVNAFSNLVTLSAQAIPQEAAGTKSPEPNQAKQEMVQEQPDIFNVPRVAWLMGGLDGQRDLTVEDFTGGADDWRGLRILEEIDEVSILCAPDAVLKRPSSTLNANANPNAIPGTFDGDAEALAKESPPVPLNEESALRIYRVMIDQCERLRDRIAILDYPREMHDFNQLRVWKTKLVTRFGAIYYPWLRVPDPLGDEGDTRRVPTAGHVAGVFARIDNQFGVHRPPANAALEFVTDVMDKVTDLGQQRLNPYGINIIRAFPNRGIRVWGARSLADLDDTDWRYIHARRLMCMIEESVGKSTHWAVFEPNDFTLRQTLVHSLSVFLGAIWRNGGLKGSLPSNGFYVKCDETNNPPAVVDAGQLICEVGVAVADPMEFLVFQIHQSPGATEIAES